MASPPPKTTKLRIALALLVVLLFFSSIVLITFLALDVFTIPYLTPFADFLAIILSPFLPLLAPLTLGAFLKICQHETFPGKKIRMFITGGWCLNHVQRVSKDVAGLYLGRGENGGVELCGLNECRRDWVEAGLFVLIVVGQWRRWRWDFGVVEKWVESVVAQANKQEEKKRRKAAGGDVERGVREDKVDEKKKLVVEEEVFGGDMDKTALLVEI